MNTRWQYDEDTSINQSRLKKILVSNYSYLTYQPNLRTDDDPAIYKDDALAFGKFQEDLLINPEYDKEKYFVAPEGFTFPTEWATEATHKYFDLKKGFQGSEEELILKSMEGLYRTTKDPIKRVAKFKESCTNYIEYLKNSNGKETITEKQYQLALENMMFVRDFEPYREEFIESSSPEVEILNTVRYKWESYKMEIDKLRIDHKLKTITLSDMKTCPQARTFFWKNFTRFRYDFQLAFYARGVRKKIEKDYPGYTLNPVGQFLVMSNTHKHPPVIYHWDLKFGEKDYRRNGILYEGVETALRKLDKLNNTQDDLEKLAEVVYMSKDCVLDGS